MAPSESLVNVPACFTGICVVQHQRINQNFSSDIFMPDSHVWDSKEKWLLHFEQKYLFSDLKIFLERHFGQNTFLPNKIRRRYFLIWTSDGI